MIHALQVAAVSRLRTKLMFWFESAALICWRQRFSQHILHIYYCLLPIIVIVNNMGAPNLPRTSSLYMRKLNKHIVPWQYTWLLLLLLLRQFFIPPSRFCLLLYACVYLENDNAQSVDEAVISGQTQ